MKIVCISDTHEKHRRIEMPECDVLVHSGDMVTDFYKMGSRKMDEYEDFFSWFSAQPAKHKICIAGNHDFAPYYPNTRTYFLELIPDDVLYLQDEEVTIDGVKFYGTPWQPDFFNYAFNVAKTKNRQKLFAKIPVDTNVLLTHMPPYGILDMLPNEKNVGCAAILERIQNLPHLKLHVFGHVHYAYGIQHLSPNDTIYVNAALCGPIPYDIINKPIEIEI
jgi:Icc-related predicted phosphoesterase